MGAALLVLLGLALFVAGLMTAVNAWYWACVAACAGAAVLIVLARRSMTRSPDGSTAAVGTADGTVDVTATGATVATAPAAGGSGRTVQQEHAGEPPVEEVEVTDLLLVVDLTDEVLVVDEHPRYHLAGCAHLEGRSTIPLPLDEARADGFTPCGTCRPDRTLAERARGRRQGG